MRFLLKVAGYLIELFSGLFILVYLFLLFDEEYQENWYVIVALILFLVGCAYGGFYLIRLSKRLQLEALEKIVLQTAATKEGRVTPEEIAVSTELTVEESRRLLDELCARGTGQLQITEQGNLVYVFSGLLSEAERASSRGPLDG